MRLWQIIHHSTLLIVITAAYIINNYCYDEIQVVPVVRTIQCSISMWCPCRTDSTVQYIYVVSVHRADSTVHSYIRDMKLSRNE